MNRLEGPPRLDDDVRARLVTDYVRFSESGLPPDLALYLRENYGVDVAGRYAGLPIAIPFGKGSGQLTMKPGQIRDAIDGPLGFAVLKTVIARDAVGDQSMTAWTIHAPRMVCEPLVGRTSGKRGWTVSWRGRGWSESFDAYRSLLEESYRIAAESGFVVAPSVKYHLPAPGETAWRVDEYLYTTRALLDVHERCGPKGVPLVVEKDFSPTLAGSDRASTRAGILAWLAEVPRLIREAAGEREIRIGLKLFNALDDVDFQVAMLEAVHERERRPDFIVYANRLFDPDREFDGVKGIAYGGPDLSDRNLEALARFRRAKTPEPIEISATGDVSSGRIAAEYLSLGCSSFQIHTGFQLPLDEYPMTVGSRVQRTLHRLLFDPDEGFVAWLLHLGRSLELKRDGLIRALDVAEAGSR